MKKHGFALIFLFLFSIPIVRPLLGSGYFTMHDDTQIARVVVMGRAIRNGQLPVRWVSGLGYGYGYPLYNFYGPLPYYLGGFLYAAGLPPLAATKVMMGVGMLVAVLAMYALSQHLFGRAAGVLGGLLYAYGPYHAVQLYVRGAVGELWAYALLPLFFYGLVLLTGARRLRGILIGGCALGGIILSHTIFGYVTVVLYIGGLALYSLILLFRRRFHFSHFDFAQCRLFTFHFSLLSVGLLMSAFFWLPAITEMGYTSVAEQIGATADFRNHFVCLPQLWNSLWGYGGSAPGCIDGMSFKVGKLHLILALVGTSFAFWRFKWRLFQHSIVGLFIITGLVGVFMVTSAARPLWEIIPGFSFVQYPWRLIALIVFAVSIIGGSAVAWIPWRWMRVGVTAVLVLSAIFLNAKLFVPQVLYERAVDFWESKEEISWRVSAVSDEYLPPAFIKPANPSSIAHALVLPREGMKVETEIDTELYVKIVVFAQIPTDITIQKVYFPGWKYWVNGVRQDGTPLAGGLPTLTIPAGRSVVEFRFTDTAIRSASNIISILTIACLAFVYGKKSIA